MNADLFGPAWCRPGSPLVRAILLSQVINGALLPVILIHDALIWLINRTGSDGGNGTIRRSMIPRLVVGGDRHRTDARPDGHHDPQLIPRMGL
jgi:hypothetical protein